MCSSQVSTPSSKAPDSLFLEADFVSHTSQVLEETESVRKCGSFRWPHVGRMIRCSLMLDGGKHKMPSSMQEEPGEEGHKGSTGNSEEQRRLSATAQDVLRGYGRTPFNYNAFAKRMSPSIADKQRRSERFTK